MNSIAGKRVEEILDGSELLQPGEYGKNQRGTWDCCTPNGCQGNLANHTIQEHEDGTITVTPSILVHPHHYLDTDGVRKEKPGWHGYLTRGLWVEA